MGTAAPQTFVTSQKPVSGYVSADTFSCSAPYTSNFTASPTCNTCSYTWSFPGGTPFAATGPNASSTYSNYGQYTVSLTVRDTINGCTTTIPHSNFVKIHKLVPQFSANQYKGCGPLCVTLQNTTVLTGIPVTLSSTCWFFPGSGFADTCANSVRKCFSAAGCHSVGLILTTNTGCVDTTLLLDTICVGNPPHCSLTYGPTTMCFEKDTVVFNLNCLVDTFNDIRVHWGDGTPDQDFTGVPFHHIYEDTGVICTTIVLYRDSCKGDSLNACVTINPPVAKFVDSFNCHTGDTVFLNNQSIGATSYSWYLACNGQTSTALNPVFELPFCDTCTVTLTAFNSVTGCTNKKTQIINTSCNQASFTPADTQVCIGHHVIYTNTSASISTSNTGSVWDFDTLGFHNDLTFGPGHPNVHNGNPFNINYQNPGQYVVALQNTTAAGCKDTTYGTITVCKVHANFTNNAACFPDSICFLDSSTSPGCAQLIYTWTFGPGIISNAQNPCYSFDTSGTFPVKLVVRNSIGCVDSITKQVVVSSPVNLSWNVDTFICPGAQTCITNNSTGVALVYTWVIPGASSLIGLSTATPCFTYNTPTDTLIKLHLSSNNQCALDDSILIHVHAPIAGGYASSTYISCPNPPQIIQFTDTSHYADSIWHWTFGDGAASTQQNPSHIYDSAGVYYPVDSVWDKQGCLSAALIDTITVAGPYGNFSEYPTPGICSCKDSIHFSITTVSATNLIFLLGCNQTGPTINQITPVGTPQNPSVIDFAASYCLTDTCQPQVVFGDASGCHVYLTRQFVFIDSPVIKFTIDNFGVCNNGTVCFHDSTHYHLWSYQSYTIQWIWNFGDGSAIDSTSGPNPCHYYAQPGGYNATLYIRSNLGCFDSLISQVVVPDFPIAGFYALDSFACALSPMCFQDTSHIDPLTHAQFWIWNFGDNTGLDTVYTSAICHSYATGGIYTVTMCVFDSIGCSNCTSSQVKIIANPVANPGGDTVVCYGAVVQLNGSGGTSCLWYPGTLVSDSNSCNPTVQLYGDTSVSLIVQNSHGCADTASILLTVARVFAGFIVNPTFCLSDSICVIDSSSGLNGALSNWVYNFGDNQTLNGASVCHKYSVSGNYTITQTATDIYGCTDSSSNTILIFPSPVGKFSLNDTVICSNKPVCITDLSTSIVPVTSWVWNYGDGTSATGNTPPCHLYSPQFQSSYNVMLVVTDQNQCFDTAQLMVTVNAIPIADFIWATSCEDDSMPLTSSSTQGGAPIVSCQWTFWLGAPSPVISNNCNSAFQFPPGSHDVQLVITDLNGCSDTIVKTVLTDSLSRLLIYPGDTTICLGTAVNYTVKGVFNNIRWSPTIWLSNPADSIVTVNPLSNITYLVSASNGACAAAHDTFSIRIVQPFPLAAVAQPELIVLGGYSNITSYYPQQTSDSLVVIDSIIWTPAVTLNCSNCPNPIATPLVTTNYMATIYYSEDGISCSNSTIVTVEVTNSCDGGRIFVPNTFTPNGDGLNDVFMIRSDFVTKISFFRVFDRWGRLVFEAVNGPANDPKWGWDGNDMEGKKLNPAVYVYTYEIQCTNGNIVTGQGNVTLVR